MRVAVFGGSNPNPKDYQQALQLGRLLGTAGHTVLTGGYIGTMEAVSQGASEKGALVIGVTCDEIEAWRPIRPNPWVKEERRFKTLMQRLFSLIADCESAIALPGGPGTLAEISMMWNLLLISAIPARPLILVGEGWKSTFQQFYREFSEYTPSEQRKWLRFVKDVETAVEALNADSPNFSGV